MTRSPVCIVLFGGFAVALLCSGAPAEEVTLTDGDFANWDLASYIGPDAEAFMDWSPDMGNPGACVQVVLDVDDAGFRRAAFGLGRKDDLEWIPSVDGTIAGLRMQIDATREVGEQELKLLVYQDGNYYIAPQADSPTGSPIGHWSTSTWGPFSSNEFVRMDGPTREEWNLDAHPDFAGDVALKFGFAAGGEAEGGQERWDILRYDNWQLTVDYQPIPEPSTLALVAIGGLALLAGVLPKRTRATARLSGSALPTE